MKREHIELLRNVTIKLSNLPSQIDPNLFSLAVPYLLQIPMWESECLVYYLRMILQISTRLTEQLCCNLLREHLIELLRRSNQSIELLQELLKLDTARFIRDHFGMLFFLFFVFCFYFFSAEFAFFGVCEKSQKNKKKIKSKSKHMKNHTKI